MPMSSYDVAAVRAAFPALTAGTAHFDGPGGTQVPEPATGELDDVATVLSDRTKLVAVTGASNLIGTRPPVVEIAGAVHDAGALLAVDGVHLTAHVAVDVAAIGADFYTCSPYKFLGP